MGQHRWSPSGSWPQPNSASAAGPPASPYPGSSASELDLSILSVSLVPPTPESTGFYSFDHGPIQDIRPDPSLHPFKCYG